MTKLAEFDENGHKRILKYTGNTLDHYALDGDIVDVLDVLNQLVEDYGDNVNISLHVGDDYDETVYNIYTYVYETDLQRDKRLAAEKQYRENEERRLREKAERDKKTAQDVERHERALLASLLKKYGE